MWIIRCSQITILLTSLTYVLCSDTLGLRSDNVLNGFGASFPGEIYEAWMSGFENYRSAFESLECRYRVVGSGRGKAMAKGLEDMEEQTEYYGSDSVLTESEYANYSNLAMVPILAGPVVLSYNLPGVKLLNLTEENIVGIYNGTYRWWNESAIQDANPEVLLPSHPIRVLARNDQSGTTEMFTSALCKFSEEWCITFGNFSEGLDENESPIFWDENAISFYATTNRGMSGVVMSLRYSIGYLSSADAMIASLDYATILQDGEPVLPSVVDLTNAMERSKPHLGERLAASLVNYVQPGEYPIIGYSYFIVDLTVEDQCELYVELVRFMEWCVEDPFPGDISSDFLMITVDKEIGMMNDEKVYKKMTCDGQLLHPLVDEQKHREWLSTQKWRMPVFITTPIVGAALIALIIYIAVQQAKLKKALLSDEWKIARDSIMVAWSRSFGLVTNYGPGSAVSLNISTISHVSLTVSPHVWGVGTWQEKPVCLRNAIARVNINSKDVRRTILWMRYKVLHANVLRLYGVTFIDGSELLVSDHCPKGTLSDVVQNDKYRIDDNIKFSLALDVVMGMQYLHSQSIIHGRLRSDSCFIDQRWQVKISDWEYYKLDEMDARKKISKVSPSEIKLSEDEEDPNILARKQLFCSPETLQDPSTVPKKPADVYSFSMVALEIFTRDDPFSGHLSHMEPTELVQKVREKNFRPNVDDLEPHAVALILINAWQFDPDKRPTFVQLKKQMKKAKPSGKSVMDSMMEVLEGYVNSLEEKVVERTVALEDANKGMENLLHQILPPSVAKKLSLGETIDPESFETVTIYFSDIVGFTKLSAASTPLNIVNMLNDLYTTFDSVIENHDVYKVETIGDAYMVISGLPKRNGDLHASHIATMSLDLMAAAGRFIIRHKPGDRLNLRAGMHSGSVVAGVVGLKMPRYCLFGDTVNTAARMESTSETMKIQVSGTTGNLLRRSDGFVLEQRGEIDVKGKGTMMTYFLKGKDGYIPLNPATGNYCYRFLNK